jgi:hypothetical protein
MPRAIISFTVLVATPLIFSACGGGIGSGLPLDAAQGMLIGADCNPAVDLACDADTFCAGLPQGDDTGTGTCLEMCGCVTIEDCYDPGNLCYHIQCVGEATCEAGRCGWECGFGNPSQEGSDNQGPAQEGAVCDVTRGCADGLGCKNVVDGAGTCQPRGWCKEATVYADCAGLLENDAQGDWTCDANRCVWVPDDRSSTSARGNPELGLNEQVQVDIRTPPALSFRPAGG